jgi:uncharacterized protein YkwD
MAWNVVRIVLKRFFLAALLGIPFYTCETLGINLERLFASSSSDASSSTNGTATSSRSEQRADADAAHWDMESLDTARDVEYLSAVEKDVVLEMNKVRSDPKKYAEQYIQPELRYYNGNRYSKPGQTTIQTQEGKKAVEACIAALSKMKSVPPLKPELGLSLGARDHTADQGKTGKTGHDGSDRSTPFTRIKRYGTGYTAAGENLAYGSTTGREIVSQLLIDDGVPSRGHRTNIMSKDFDQTGVSFGKHPQFRTACTITYAKGYVSNE